MYVLMAFNSPRFSSRGQSRTFRRDLSLRTVLIVPFVVQIAAAVGLVGYLSFRSGQNAINDLVNQLENQAVDRVNQHLDTYLASPHQALQIANDSIQLGLLDINNFPITRQYFWKLLQRFETISSIGFGNEQERFTDVTRIDSNKFYMGVKDESTGKDQIEYLADQQGNLTDKQIDTVKNYRPTIRPWYQTAKEANRQTWSKLFQTASDSEAKLQITAVLPYRDQQGNFVGVLETGLSISNIVQFLNQIKISPSGRVFIMERDGMLVASSNNSPVFTVKDRRAERLAANNSSDPLIQEAAKYLAKSFPDLNQITNRQKLEYSFDGQRQFALVEPWQDKFGLNWLIVTIVPESDFMAQINTNTQTTIILCLLALMVAIALGLFTIRWIVGLILKLQNASQAIAQGNLDQTVEISGVTELENLSHVFNQMAGQLKTSFDNQEQLVQERTQELSQALENLQTTQQELIQSEKMAALGQLVAGIAHEINTPLGAIRASISNISSGLETSLTQLPKLLEKLSPPQQVEFIDLLTTACQIHPYLSTREIRKLKCAMSQELENYEMSEPEVLAEALVQMGITDNLVKFLPLLKSEHRELILETANNLSSQFRNSDNINVAVDRAAKIIYALKSYARQDTSGQKVMAKITENIDIVLTLYHNQIKQKIELIQNYQPIPDILCYPEELSQVWTNLIYNAIQAMNYKGTLQINVFQQDQSVVVQVIDSGVGIAPEIQGKIFEPFFTTKPAGEGSGLGLDIVSKIIKKHGGAIAVSSQPGQTSFSIFLPISE